MRKMKTLSAIVFCGLFLVNCTTPTPAFNRMSEQELLAYNTDKPILNQVYCQKQATTSSRIRKLKCQTVSDWVHNISDDFMRLEVLSTNGIRFR